MSEQSRAWDAFLDRVADGEKPTVEGFARTALTDLPRVDIKPRRLTNKSAWPPEVWAEMQKIWSDQ